MKVVLVKLDENMNAYVGRHVYINTYQLKFRNKSVTTFTVSNTKYSVHLSSSLFYHSFRRFCYSINMMSKIVVENQILFLIVIVYPSSSQTLSP